MERFIAKRFRSFGGGLALDTGAISKYTDLIDLSIGDTDIVTDEKIISAAFRDAKAGHTHYGDPHGDPELIDAFCRAWSEDFGQAIGSERVLVTASSCLGMSLVMLGILDPGDEVLVFSPYFPMYREQIELAGGVCVEVPTYASENFAIKKERLEAAITPRTKAMIFNNPQIRRRWPTTRTRCACLPRQQKSMIYSSLPRDIHIIYVFRAVYADAHAAGHG